MQPAPSTTNHGGKPLERVGAYGLHLPGVGDPVSLVEAPVSWASWRFSFQDQEPDMPWQWSADEAQLPLQPVGRAVIDRRTAHTVLCGVPRNEEALLHPYLGSTALAVAAWAGHFALHAGVVLAGNGAWGLVGEREAGKSSALAWCIGGGLPVVADDLLITDGSVVFAGPRFVDLRQGAAERFGLGRDVGVLGTRRRWRVPVPAVESHVPFGGLVELAWGPAPSVSSVPVSERLAILGRHKGFRIPVDDRLSLMHVLARPMLRFTRPRSWSAMDASMTLLITALTAAV